MTNQLSKEYTEKLRVLEDAVPPQPSSVVLETIRQDFGQEPKEIFSEFDEIPVGSASIGQVHRAVLAKTGETVAVKVQYPTSRKLFMTDMMTIRTFFEIAAPEQVLILDELEASFQREFDYREEAKNLQFFYEKLGLFQNHVQVPKPIQATKRVLIMEYLDGPKVIDGVRAYGELVARQQGKTLSQLEREMEAKIRTEGSEASYKGPSEWQISAYLALMQSKDKILNSGVYLANLLPWGKKWEYFNTTLPPNAPYIMSTLMQVHGYELLKLGRFNSDCHAGNFLLLKNGKIGIIDVGATKVLTRGERLSACLLYAALFKNDKKMILDLVRTSGYKSKYFDEEVIFDLIRFNSDTFGKDLLKGRNVQQFIDELYARDPWYEAANNLTMALFMSIRIRAVGIAMNHPVVCSQWWGPLALEILEQEGLPYEEWNAEMMPTVFGKPNISKGAVSTKLFSF